MQRNAFLLPLGSMSEPAVDPDRFVPSGVWHVIVDTKRQATEAERGPYGSFPVPDPRFMNVTETPGGITLTLGWDHGIVIIEHAQRAFRDARSPTSQDLSDAFFALWRLARKAGS